MGWGSDFAQRFEVHDVIGHGTLGTTFGAIDRSSGARAVLKLLHRDLLPTPAALHTFRAASREAARLDESAFTSVLGVDVDSLYPRYAMTPHAGVTLRRLMERRSAQRRPFSLAEAGRLARAISHALQLLHRSFPAHGLLKPENVIVGPGMLHLCDVHLTTSVEPHALARTQRTSRYFAPELTVGVPPSPQADVYSFAALVVELLTGRQPQASPRNVFGDLEGLPEALDMLLCRCLDENPSVRPQSPRALADRLAAYLSDLGGVAGSTCAGVGADTGAPDLRFGWSQA